MEKNDYVTIIMAMVGLLYIYSGIVMKDLYPTEMGLMLGVGFSTLTLSAVNVLFGRIQKQKRMIEDLQEHLERLGNPKG